MATVPNGMGVSVQYEHLHTILYRPFLLVSVSVNALALVVFWSIGPKNVTTHYMYILLLTFFIIFVF